MPGYTLETETALRVGDMLLDYEHRLKSARIGGGVPTPEAGGSTTMGIVQATGAAGPDGTQPGKLVGLQFAKAPGAINGTAPTIQPYSDIRIYNPAGALIQNVSTVAMLLADVWVVNGGAATASSTWELYKFPKEAAPTASSGSITVYGPNAASTLAPLNLTGNPFGTFSSGEASRVLGPQFNVEPFVWVKSATLYNVVPFSFWAKPTFIGPIDAGDADTVRIEPTWLNAGGSMYVKDPAKLCRGIYTQTGYLPKAVSVSYCPTNYPFPTSPNQFPFIIMGGSPREIVGTSMAPSLAPALGGA
jgi:hypothetical protein